MKNLISFFILSLLFFSCSSDENTSNNDELEFIQIKVTSTDASMPKGKIALLYLGDKNLESITVADGKIIGSTGSNEYIYPVSKKTEGEDLVNGKDNYSIKSFYWNELSSLYGTPQPGKKYVVFIKLKEGKTPIAYKVFTISKNSSIDVHIPSASEYSEIVNADWKISDYHGS